MIKRTFMHIVKYRKSIRNLNNLHLRGLLFMPLGGGKSTRRHLRPNFHICRVGYTHPQYRVAAARKLLELQWSRGAASTRFYCTKAELSASFYWRNVFSSITSAPVAPGNLCIVAVARNVICRLRS